MTDLACDTSAPDQTAWWDADRTFENVMKTLRLAPGDIDDDRVKALIPAAGYQVNLAHDRPSTLVGEPPTGTAPTAGEITVLQPALEQAVIEAYANPLQEGLSKAVLAQIGTLKHRWPIG